MSHSSLFSVTWQDKPASKSSNQSLFSQSTSDELYEIRREELNTPLKYAGSKFHTTSPSPNSLPIPLTILSIKTTRSSSLSESTTAFTSNSLPNHYLSDIESLKKKGSKSDAENPFTMTTNINLNTLNKSNQKVKTFFSNKGEASNKHEKLQSIKKEEHKISSHKSSDKKKSMYQKNYSRQSAPIKLEKPLTTNVTTPKILKNTTRHSQPQSQHTNITASHNNITQVITTSPNIPSKTTSPIFSQPHSKEPTHLNILSDNLKQMLKIVDSPMA